MASDFFCGGPIAVHQILPFIDKASSEACRIDAAVSFVRLSGVRLLLSALRQMKKKGMPVRLICGSYLGITEPAALQVLLHELGPDAEIRLFNNPLVSFHPKCWIFHHENEDQTQVLIGSSNLSRSALTSGIEWNYAFERKGNESAVDKISESFESLWNQSDCLNEKAIEDYAASRVPLQSQGWMDVLHQADEEASRNTSEAENRIEPNAMQTEALYRLQETRAQGAKRALVQAATGTGKTVLAALDSRAFSRVLFVAHRYEILMQAAETFHQIRPDASIGFIGQMHKDLHCDLTFASVQTLAKETLLKEDMLAPDAFDYIVIDEFHHAAACSYLRILSYFRPAFLLGLTATPYRLDGRDLYALCDYNVPYQITLFDAIAQGYLSPFRYYGIYDPTDYENVRIRGMHFDVQGLEKAYNENTKRAELIYRHYRKHPSNRGLGFCVSRSHARFMARYFQKKGVQCAAVVSDPDLSAGSVDLERTAALRRLAEGELKILFCVDLFNEGTDVPLLDLVMFLRPTESAVIYLQQLGRGLRKARGKEFLTVLDFIGNYKSASLGPSLISSIQGMEAAGPVNRTPVPSCCVVDFDLELIDLLETLAQKAEDNRKRGNPAATAASLFEEVRESLGHVPSRVELYRELQEEDLAWYKKHSSFSPFKNYLGFLEAQNLLDEEQKTLLHSSAGEFLKTLETTQLSRVYKLAVLEVIRLCLRETGSIPAGFSQEQILRAWKEFFSRGKRWIDLDVSSRAAFDAIPDRKYLQKIRSMPIKYLLASFDGMLEQKDGALLSFREDLQPYLSDPLFQQQILDILDCRTEDYYASRFEDGIRKSAGIRH